MFKNYLKIAFRNLVKYKGHAFINLVGLSTGITVCLLVYLFVRHEWTFDRFNKNAHRIYRVIQHERKSTRSAHSFAETPVPLGPTLKQHHPEIVDFARVATSQAIVRRGANRFQERVHLVDPSLLSIFTFPLLQGDPQTALQDPGSVVVTESMAMKYFGDQPALGQQLNIQLGSERRDFVVSGVARDVPRNSSIRFDFLLSFENMKMLMSERARNHWGIIVSETFLELAPRAQPATVAERITATVQDYYNQVFEPGLVQLFLQPLTDIHLNPTYEGGSEPVSHPAYSIVLGSIALLILLIACINFTILTTGRCTYRACEIGVRKVLGANRAQLRRQFWGEATFLSVLATALAVGLAELFLPAFNRLSGQQLSFQYDAISLLVLAGAAGLVGLVAGSYPSLVLSRFSPIAALRGQLKVGREGGLQQALVVTQFTISIALIISTFLMLSQVRYLRSKDLGFDKEQVVVIRPGGSLEENARLLERFRNALQHQLSILSVAGSATTVGQPWAKVGYTDTDGLYREFYSAVVDYDYIKTMKLNIVAGRGFSREVPSDLREAIVVNETLVKEYGWESPIGQHLPSQNFQPHRVIGVLSDFNFQSLHARIKPLVLALDTAPLRGGIENIDGGPLMGMNVISVRLGPGDLPQTLALLERTWKEIAPSLPFQFSFLDDNLEQQYSTEVRLSKIASYSAALAIVIACLGLFSLVAFAAERRTKEIGIRKVLGATVTNVVALLSKDFVKLVLLANIIAWPVAWWAMNKWLQNFAYRISIEWWVFVLAGILALAIALVTVSTQAVRAALANPVESLRYE
ncbi:ABC transporter permease [Candidatus Parcubacteria bacterium]|nr:MAG: ABC transporter permease [Candidatus Parcubacteria bacterium]